MKTFLFLLIALASALIAPLPLLAQSKITSPSPGSTLTQSSLTLNWQNVGAAQYVIYVGSAQGGNDLVSQSMGTGTSTTITWKIPPASCWVRLWSYLPVYSGYRTSMPAYYTWAFTDCIYYYKQAQPATQAAASKYNFKLPFAGGHSWICTAQANDPGDSGHQGDNYYSLDFVRSGWPKVNQDVDVFAMHGGKVVEVFSGPLDSTKGASYGGFPANGFFVRVDMDGDNNKKTGFVTVYCHLKYPPMWRVGDTIKAGDWVGYMGTTGHSTGEHLHLTFKYDGNGQYPQSEVEKVLIEGIGIRSFRTGKTYTSTRS